MVLVVRVVLFDLRMACGCVFDGFPLLEREWIGRLEENGYAKGCELEVWGYTGVVYVGDYALFFLWTSWIWARLSTFFVR